MIEIIMGNPILSSCSITLFGFVAVHRLALHRQKESFRIVAANEFVSTITSEFSEIYPVSSNWPEDIDCYLRNKFPILQSAIENYKPYVKNQEGFNKAWDFYRLGEDGRIIDKQLYLQYMGFQSNDEPAISPEVRLRENINQLLSYAKTSTRTSNGIT